jgi:hypothetical protein
MGIALIVCVFALLWAVIEDAPAGTWTRPNSTTGANGFWNRREEHDNPGNKKTEG